MPVFRPKRTNQLGLEENECENNQNSENSHRIISDKNPKVLESELKPADTKNSDTSLVSHTISQLKIYDSTPVPSTQAPRRPSSSISKWAPKKTQELAMKFNESSTEVTDPVTTKIIPHIPKPPDFRPDPLLEEEESDKLTSLQSETNSVDKTPDSYPPAPRFMSRSSMAKLKSRGRQVLGMINQKDTGKEFPGIFRNIRSPDMKASMDISRLSDVTSSSESTGKGSPIHLNFDCSSRSSAGKETKSTALIKLADILQDEEKKELVPFVLDVLDQSYEIESILGKGGTGTVFVGKTKEREYAIKVTEVNGDEERMSGFYREAALMRKLKDNKHVIQIYYDTLIDGYAFIVMEKGLMDLYRHLLTFTTEIPLYTLAKWFYDMMIAVKSIHELGIIHADLKPANFLVMPNGDLKLTDFGISKMKQRLSESILAEQEVVMAGTLNFLCPEAVTSIMNQKPSILNETADIWSLGVIFYYLIYKELPFGRATDKREKMLAIADAKNVLKFPRISRFYPEMFRELTIACLQYDCRLRPKAAELIEHFPINMIIPINDR